MEQSINQFMFYFIPLFGVLFLSVFVWFFLVFKLYKLLASNHPEYYEGMGKPTLFWNNSPKSSLVLMKFILKKEYLQLHDKILEKHGNLMFAFFLVYLVLFTVLFILSFLMAVNVQSNINP